MRRMREMRFKSLCMTIHTSMSNLNCLASSGRRSGSRRAIPVWQIPIPNPARKADNCAKSESQVFHFRGHWLQRGVEMAEQVCRRRGMNVRAIKDFPWWMVRMGAPILNVFQEMLEMRYLWQIPLELDNAKLRAYLGSEPHTHIEQALAATLPGDGKLRDLTLSLPQARG
jgi:hypothetical protein